MLDRRDATNIKRRLAAFVDAVGWSHTIPAKRFLSDALTGILASGDVKLSSWGRALNERCELLYTEKRLSRWMGSKRLDDPGLRRRYRELISSRLDGHVIAVDGSDLIKPCAEKMPFISTVRDGSRSTKTKHAYGNGWQYIAIEAVGADGSRAPLGTRIFSRSHPDYKSEKAELRAVITEVAPDVPAKCIWTFDRGYDDRAIFDMCDALGLRWVVRLGASKRKVFHRNRWVYAGTVAARIPIQHEFQLLRPKKWCVSVGWTRVRIVAHSARRYVVVKDKVPVPEDREFCLVVVRGKGPHPLVLLTSMDLRTAADAELIANAYMHRWGIEERFRFTKVAFNLEDVRVLRWRALQRMMTLVLLAYGFLCAEKLRRPGRMRLLLRRVARAFFRVPKFDIYRVQEAVGALLTLLYLQPRGPRGPPRRAT